LAQAGRGAGVEDSTAGSAAPAPENVYRQIYLDYNRKEYQLALDESEAFLRDYPDDALGEDVLFIRGSCLMELQNYADAVKEFSNLVQAYPQGRRAPGALLRTAVAYDMLGDKEVAAGVVRRLLKEYPRSEEASAAKERFATLLKE
jgi:tol-pal system protein YbgF